jgi:hypothetical protein
MSALRRIAASPPAMASEEWVWALTVMPRSSFEDRNRGRGIVRHDLYPFERDGLEVVEWMIDHQVFPRLVAVHSSNEAASTWMCGLLQRAGYRPVPGKPRQFLEEDAATRPTEERTSAPSPPPR